MKIIRQPVVYLVGRQTVDDMEIDRFLVDHGVESWGTDTEVGGEILSEVAGRVCYMSFAKPRPGGSEAYLRNIKASGHGSVLEHAVWNLLVTGVSRTCSHELVRHRAGWGYSQLSQRYVDESVAEYICPDAIAEDAELFQLWQDAVSQSHAAYVELVNRLDVKLLRKAGVRFRADGTFDAADLESLSREDRTQIRKESRQAARSVLPGATETKLFITVNARALRHFVELRGSTHAEPEIRKVAVAIVELMAKEAPNIFGDYSIGADGSVSTAWQKV